MHKGSVEYQRMLQAMVDAVMRNTGGVSVGGRWPMPVFDSSTDVSLFTFPRTIPLFMEVTNKLVKEGLDYTEIGKKYRHPSRLARMMHGFLSRALWPMQLEKYPEVGERLANILMTMYIDNPYAKDGNNIIYPTYELRERLQGWGVEMGSLDDKRQEIRRIGSLLWMLAESYSPRMLNTFFEFSGPYQIGEIFVVLREFHNLNPAYIAADYYPPFEEATIVEVYNGEPGFRVDIMNRVIKEANSKKLLGRALIIKNCLVGTDDSLNGYLQKVRSALEASSKHLTMISNKKAIIEFSAQAEAFGFLYPLLGRACLELEEGFYQSIDDKQRERERGRVRSWISRIPKDRQGWRKIFDLYLEQT